MKKFDYKFCFLISIITLVIGISTEYFFSHTSYENIDNISFSQKLQSQRNELKKVINEFDEKIKLKGLNKFLSEAFNSYSTSLAGTGLYIVVYNKKEIVYWSDNSFVNKNWQFIGDSLQPISFINNAWVVSNQKINGNISIVGFLLIKKEFPIENNYLQNTLNPKFGVDGDFNISKIPQQDAIQITDNKGNFLFSLISKNVVKVFESHGWLPGLFYSLTIVFLIIGFYKNFQFANKKYLNLILITTTIIIVIIRIIMMHYNFPHVVYLFNLFKPNDYASSVIFPSLGDVLIDSVLFLFISLLYNKYFNVEGLLKSLNKTLFLIICILFCLFLSIVISLLFKSLILDSTISFQIYNILETNYNTLIVFVIFVTLIVSELVVYNKITSILSQLYSIKLILVTFVICELIIFIFQLIFFSKNEFYSIIFNLLIFIGVTVFNFSKKKSSFYYTIYFILLTSLYLTVFTLYYEHIKSLNTRKVISVGLSNERDLVAETLLDDLQKKMSSDLLISEFAQKSLDKRYEILQYLRENYFYGFWNKYEIQTTICTSYDNLKITETGEYYGCFEYFDQIVKNKSVNIPNTDFYFVENNDGRVSYLGVINLSNKFNDSINSRIFIELDSRLQNQALGYPELLLDKKVNDANIEKKYSYAKYRNNKLLTRNGDFDYRVSINNLNNINEEFFIKNIDGFEHLYYRPDKNSLIVLSVQSTNFYDVVITFSYILVFLFIVYIVILLIKNLKKIVKLNIDLNIRSRILISFISVLILSFIFIGTVTVYYIINKYEKKNYENISEKMQSILIELNNKIGNQTELLNEQRENYTSMLIKFSNVFYSDINLYSKNGLLFASSRPEVFNKGFVGNLMNPEAFYSINYQHKPEIVLEEHIGKLKYLSAYMPYYNSNGKVIAYLNLPYFTRQNALTNEISSFATTLINIYLMLILFAMLITLFITNGLTRPIILLQRKFREIEFGKKNEPLYYKRNDEIGSLVNEYNKMLEELSKSAELLARSERETAWREMAKQIAHEIKNPLTPMKLSVQYLMRSYNEKTPGWENLVDKTSKTLIEQIDTLSAIASEFSMFARLPSPIIEKINIVENINSIIELYKQSENVQIVFENNNFNKIFVYADKEQMLRIFTNLIKNAIQAVPDDRNGIIKIDLNTSNYNVIIKIEDNGIGITDEVKSKLFIPNFTTKSSGMGLGLTMVKNMIEGIKGKITYETKVGIGTTFIVEIPYVK